MTQIDTFTSLYFIDLYEYQQLCCRIAESDIDILIQIVSYIPT